MASFTRVHGDSKPVFESDRLAKVDNGGSEVLASGIPVNVAGPHLEFFSIDLGASATGQLGTGGAVEAAIRAIQQLSVVYMYQVDGDKLSVATYPVGAWGNAADGTAGYNLTAAITACGTVNGYSLGSASVLGKASSATAADGSNNGFALIAS